MVTSTRIGGVLLMLAAISLPIIIVDYVMIMSGLATDGEPSIMDRATFAKDAYPELAQGWRVEILAIAAVACSSFIFLNRPSRAGWALAAIGALITIPMYPIMLGGYGEVFKLADLDAELFIVLRGITVPFFYVGQGLMMMGFGLAFLLESQAAERVLPRWALWVGSIANTVAGGVFLLLHFGLLDDFMFSAPFAMVGFLLTALLGVRLAAKAS
ncbi:MAG: hypothetical protein HRU11_04795 [Parvularculaceae bacterium]|nr:hypothetical protein [Parvularculaceae bacterium]